MKICELTEKYTYRVEWSEEDKTHIARCLDQRQLKLPV